MNTNHGAPYPRPGCPICERMARDAGHESVADFLAKRDGAQ